MATPVISKGSSFVLSTGSQELKSIIIADPSVEVGEAENTSVIAHDGTKYQTTGNTGDSTLGLEMIQTYDDFTNLMTYAYGSPSITGSVSTWDLSSPSNTSGTITITSPTADSKATSWILVDAKALSVTPGLPLGGFATMTMNIAGDNWKASLDENA